MQPFCAKPLRQLLRLTSMARTSAEKAELAHLRADRGRLILHQIILSVPGNRVYAPFCLPAVRLPDAGDCRFWYRVGSSA